MSTTIVTELPPPTDQVLPGQQVGSGKEVAGVIDTGIREDQDMLKGQAIRMALARNGGRGTIVWEQGAELPDDFVQQVGANVRPGAEAFRAVSAGTINSLQGAGLQRDQQYVGNNTDWTGYYLEPLAKFVVPFDTPFRNMLPRTPSVGIDVENWRAITSVFNGLGPSVRSFVLSQINGTSTQFVTPQQAQYVWVPQSNLLRMLAWSDAVTFETELYSRMFEPDVRAKVAAKLVPSLMLGQEVWYLNSSQNLWAPPPPNGFSTSTSGGSITAATYWFIVTAVNTNAAGTGAGTGESLGFGGTATSTTPTVIPTQVTTGSTSTITFNIPRVPGAFKYNVYVGSGATQPAMSAMYLQSASSDFGGATALNDPGGLQQGWMTVTMTAVATGTTAYSSLTANTAINSSSGASGTPANTALTFDGIQSLIYLNNLGATLSTVGEGGETPAVFRVADSGGQLAKSDIDTALRKMYYNSRANPECMLVSVADHQAISNIVAQAAGFRIITPPTQAGLADLVGGARATKWINQTTGRLMDIIMCPYLMQGTIVFVSLNLPFQVAEIDKPPLRVSVNREMWSVIYPPDQSHMSRWAYGAFSNETLVSQFLGGQAVLTNIVTS